MAIGEPFLPRISMNAPVFRDPIRWPSRPLWITFVNCHADSALVRASNFGPRLHIGGFKDSGATWMSTQSHRAHANLALRPRSAAPRCAFILSHRCSGHTPPQSQPACRSGYFGSDDPNELTTRDKCRSWMSYCKLCRTRGIPTTPSTLRPVSRPLRQPSVPVAWCLLCSSDVPFIGRYGRESRAHLCYRHRPAHEIP